MGWQHTRSPGLVPFHCPLSLNPGFYPRACMESALVFLLLAPCHSLLGSRQRAALGSLLWFAISGGRAGEAGGHCACGCTLGSGSARGEQLKSRGEHSASSCRAQGAQATALGCDTPAPLCQAPTQTSPLMARDVIPATPLPAPICSHTAKGMVQWACQLLTSLV